MTSKYEREFLIQGKPRPNELNARILTTTALMPWPGHVSSARIQMFNSMLSQTITTKGASTPTVFTGEEPKYGQYTSPIVFKEDSNVVKVITRYPRHLGMSVVKEPPEKLAILTHEYRDPVSGRLRNEVDILELPTYHSTHAQFGYMYKYLLRVESGRYAKGTVVATSPSVDSVSGMWNYGIQIESAAITLPQIIEDGIMVSEHFCDLGTTTCHETHNISFGKRRFPLNGFGDYYNYKICPDIGELVGEDGLLLATRRYDDDLAPVIMSRAAVQRIDYKYDDPVYVTPGAKVVDIKVYRSTKDDAGHRRKPHKTPVGMTDQLNFYYKGMRRFYKDILDEYTRLKSNRGSTDLKIGRKLHRLLVDAQVAVNDHDNERLIQTWRGVAIDEWTMEITITYDVRPGIGTKLAGRYGNKGVITDIAPNDDMPTDADGNRAHFVEDIVSMFKRMNPARDIERYVSATARDTTKRLVNMAKNNVTHAVMSQYLTGYYQIVSPGTIPLVSDEQGITKSHMTNVLNDGIKVWIPPDNEPEPVEMIERLHKEYPPTYTPVTYRGMSGNMVTTKDPILIGGEYIMPLEKLGKTMTAVSTSKLSNFGIPTKLTSMDRTASPIREQAIRFGESEFRLFNATLGGDKAMDILDRSNNPAVRRAIQEKIHASEQPTNIPQLVDRKTHPRGGSRVVAMVRHFNECAGRYMVQSPIKDFEEKDETTQRP